MFKCDSCEYAKHCRNSFLSSMNKGITYEIMHSDVWEPAPIDSLLGYRYFETFVDDYSHCICIYLHKSKGNVFSSLFLFIR